MERGAGSRRGPGLGPSVWVGSLEEGEGCAHRGRNLRAMQWTRKGGMLVRIKGNRKPNGSGTQRGAGVGANTSEVIRCRWHLKSRAQKKSLSKQPAERGGP